MGQFYISGKNIEEALEKMQSEYDNESNYSINKEGQALWKDYVAKELKRLHKYKS